EVYKRETYGEMKDKIMDKVHDKMKMSDMSPRLKSMMTAKYDITDERLDEIKLKYKEKFGDLSDEKRSELKMKFENHMATIKTKMSDERKSAIHDRLADMKAFKSELRERSSELTDEEKQQLRADFIQKAKDMQLAWISPRVQMNAGIDVQEIECREGFSLVMKASNGVPMCLKSNTALKLIEKGIAVPAN
ncbi:MAG: ABC transporter substrate-binding protein, partial [Nitrosarchaeum sp.]